MDGIENITEPTPAVAVVALFAAVIPNGKHGRGAKGLNGQEKIKDREGVAAAV